MESFRIDRESGRDFHIEVEEVDEPGPDLIRTLIDIDLQTFAEATFSPYAAASLLANGRIYLLRADEVVIGTCVCMRCWDRPTEAMILTMGIRPGWRGRGLGQRFVEGVMRRIAARGLRSLCLLVARDNRRAIKVYRDVGFEVVGGDGEPRLKDGQILMRARLVGDDGDGVVLTVL